MHSPDGAEWVGELGQSALRRCPSPPQVSTDECYPARCSAPHDRVAALLNERVAVCPICPRCGSARGPALGQGGRRPAPALPGLRPHLQPSDRNTPGTLTPAWALARACPRARSRAQPAPRRRDARGPLQHHLALAASLAGAAARADGASLHRGGRGRDRDLRAVRAPAAWLDPRSPARRSSPRRPCRRSAPAGGGGHRAHASRPARRQGRCHPYRPRVRRARTDPRRLGRSSRQPSLQRRSSRQSRVVGDARHRPQLQPVEPERPATVGGLSTAAPILDAPFRRRLHASPRELSGLAAATGSAGWSAGAGPLARPGTRHTPTVNGDGWWWPALVG